MPAVSFSADHSYQLRGRLCCLRPEQIPPWLGPSPSHYCPIPPPCYSPACTLAPVPLPPFAPESAAARVCPQDYQNCSVSELKTSVSLCWVTRSSAYLTHQQPSGFLAPHPPFPPGSGQPAPLSPFSVSLPGPTAGPFSSSRPPHIAGPRPQTLNFLFSLLHSLLW